jgi:hypothetical protein
MDYDREADERAWRERIAMALETIAERIGDADRVAQLEDLLREFVVIFKDPHSTDERWNELLDEVDEALNA